MKEDNIVIKVKQPLFARLFGKIKKCIKKLFFIKTEKRIVFEKSYWHGLEIDDDSPFRWSHPTSKIRTTGVSNIVLYISDPLGRELSILSNNLDTTVQLSAEKRHKIIVSTYGSKEIELRVDPFNPDSDTRSLGIQCYYVCSDDSIVLN